MPHEGHHFSFRNQQVWTISQSACKEVLPRRSQWPHSSHHWWLDIAEFWPEERGWLCRPQHHYLLPRPSSLAHSKYVIVVTLCPNTGSLFRAVFTLCLVVDMSCSLANSQYGTWRHAPWEGVSPENHPWTCPPFEVCVLPGLVEVFHTPL